MRVIIENWPSPFDLPTIITLVFALIAVIVAGFAAKTARRAAQAAEKSAEAAERSVQTTEKSFKLAKDVAQYNLTFTFMQEYGSSEMGGHLRLIRKYYNRGDITKRLKQEIDSAVKKQHNHEILSDDESELLDLNESMRQVEFYFIKAAQVIESGNYEPSFIQSVCVVWGVELYLNFIQQIQYHRSGEKCFFDIIKKTVSDAKYDHRLREYKLSGDMLCSWGEKPEWKQEYME